MYVILSSCDWIPVDVVITVISYQEKDFEKRRENNIEELESIVEWDSYNLLLTFNTVNVLKLVHSISSASIYSDHEDLFTFITMIVHLHCQHNVILHVLKIIMIHVYCLGCW